MMLSHVLCSSQVPWVCSGTFQWLCDLWQTAQRNSGAADGLAQLSQVRLQEIWKCSNIELTLFSLKDLFCLGKEMFFQENMLTACLLFLICYFKTKYFHFWCAVWKTSMHTSHINKSSLIPDKMFKLQNNFY